MTVVERAAPTFPDLFDVITANVARAVQGKTESIELALICMLAEGHLLIEDVPGVGKTSLAKAIAASIDCTWRRVQCTPDLLPSDITGVTVWHRGRDTFEFQPGPVFCNILLADEINRAAPRTQSALLEAMEERQVTADGTTRPLPRPFLVIATQNPVEHEGTYGMPDSQLDRFLLRVSLGYPDRQAELEILDTHGVTPPELESVISRVEVLGLIKAAWAIHVAPTLKGYLVDLADASRRHPSLAIGMSPRATLSILRAARVRAARAGRNYVIPDDVKALAGPVLAHRLILSDDAGVRGVSRTGVVEEVLASVPVPTGEVGGMPTRAGWAITALGAGTVLLGRLFGWLELFALGVGLVALVGVAVVLVRVRVFMLGVRRTVRPARLHVGESARVELAVANRGRITTPVLTLRDPVAGTVGARVRLAPLRPGKERQAAYRLPTSRRGILGVGPLEAVRSDPLGLARRRLTVSGTVEVIVYPRVDRVSPPPGGREQPAAVRNRQMVQAARRDSFRGLREYVAGDDLRLVHWRSSARTGELVVRQDEQPRPRATAVVLDLRRTAHAGLSLERAVSVAASVVLAGRRAGQEVVLATTDGTAMLLRPGESAATVLEYLAVARLSTSGSLRATLSGAIGVLGAGSVVLVTGRAVPAELSSLAGSRHGFLIFAVATDGSLPPVGTAMPGVRLVDGGTEERFVASWEQTMTSAIREGRGVTEPRPSVRSAAELAVVGLSVVTVLTCWRLFEGWAWVSVLVCAALLSHLVAALTRRAGWSALAALATSLVGLVVFVTVVQFRSTSFYGLPTRATWEAAQLQLRAAWDVFPTAIAPVPATGGFITAMILLVWLLAYAADDFAHRAEAPIEAVVPSGVLFVVGTALGGDRHRLAAAALWLAAAALTVAVLRVERSEGAGWFGGTRRQAVSATVRVGAALAGAAVVVGVVAGPALPGASSDPLLDTRQGRSSRTTLSPLVDIQARLVNQSDQELFTVASPRPAYWRLTALDEYDLRIWRSSRSYGDAGGDLGGGIRDELGVALDHGVQITGLDSVWLPGAFAPRRISIPEQVRYDEESGSLLTRRATLPAGLTYELSSVVPTVDAATLQARAGGKIPALILDRYLDLPSSYPDRFRDLAVQITTGATTPYEQALSLQNWFRSTFTYDLNVRPGHGATAIDTFLSQRRGYCEQFAGTFAAFARSIGVPARVAVGFTPGELGSDGRYHVRGRNAHAWPEVYLADIGWLAFEPTPGRGEPGAEQYTGVPPAQEGGPPASPEGSVPTTPTTTPSSPGGGARRETGEEELLAVPNLDGGGGQVSGGRASLMPRLGLALVVLALAGLVVLAVTVIGRERRWHRQWQTAPSPADRVLVSWHHALDGLRRAGVEIPPSDTPHEVAASVGTLLPGDESWRPAEAIDELARQATAAAYSGQVEGGDPDLCEDLRTKLQHAAVSRLPMARRLVWRFLPA